MVVGVLAAAGVAATGIVAWRAWRRVSRTRDAAAALLATHQDRLDATIVTAGTHVARLGEHGEELATSVADLRAGSEHLGWMLRKVPDSRAALRRELLDLLLPTTPKQAKAHDD